MIVVVAIIAALLRAIIALGFTVGFALRCRLWCGSCISLCSLNKLVQFAAIKPHSATLGAIIDFNAVAISNKQVRAVRGFTATGVGAIHYSYSGVCA